jgi:signal peptidase
VLGSVLAVVLVGLVLFAASGLWPPMVAVESGSMNPNLHRGDLVFVMEEHRFAAPAAHDGTGVVTFQTGERTGYRKFGGSGDVIVYRADGENGGTPIIHRARFWVNESENWYDKADPSAVGAAEACETDDDPDTDTGLRNCPAPHAGFITKGDNPVQNERYDQATGLSSPVRPSWIIGTAEFRIPYLGYVRLLFGQAAASHAGPGSAPPAAVAGTGHLTA